MKKIINVALASASIFLITGCFDKTEDKPNEVSNSNIVSNIITSNTTPSNTITSNNVVSNITPSNTTVSNVPKSNTTPVGNKTLSCTMDMTSKMGGVGYKSAITKLDIKFENSAVKLINMDMIFELDSTLAPQIDTFVSTMKSSYASTYNNVNGITVTTNKLSSTKFDVLIKMDTSKMNAEDLRKTNFGYVSGSDYEIIKQQLISSGYKCK